MRKIRELLRLAVGQGLSRRRAAAAGLGWPLPEEVEDHELETRLYRRPAPPQASRRPQPDWAEVHRELRRKGVTLQLLWMEFKQNHPEGYQYTQFVHHYRQWAGRLDVVMSQVHRAGETVFLDFAGPTVPITDPASGAVSPAQLFVAALGASNYTYVELLPPSTSPTSATPSASCDSHLSRPPCPRRPGSTDHRRTPSAQRFETCLSQTG
jgi:transposase